MRRVQTGSDRASRYSGEYTKTAGAVEVRLMAMNRQVHETIGSGRVRKWLRDTTRVEVSDRK